LADYGDNKMATIEIYKSKQDFLPKTSRTTCQDGTKEETSSSLVQSDATVLLAAKDLTKIMSEVSIDRKISSKSMK